ncbi:hypothetical protein [Fusobacterium sp.]|uniref:hypothetical protein n=1 Tax=Fusobacterium sp. TaxID=68766 RepID=UPI00290341EA|nr:hypothetical protein [Fusobacterium sp.]MDU1909922.1 hypothetical protein [Fusobacterium sp.]
MKRFILIFLMIHTFSYSNYLISNSEIVLFYDKNFNSVHFIKGDIFNPIDISKIEGKIIIDGNEIISVNRFFNRIEMVPGTNILKLYYSINGQDIDVTIIPSMLEREKLYLVVDLKNLKTDKKIGFAFHIFPQQDNGNTEFIRNSNSYVYGKHIFFKSENYGGEVFIGRDDVIENFVLEQVTTKTKKYQDDNLYYLINNVNKDEPILFTFKFFENFKNNNLIKSNDVIAAEFNYWLGLKSEQKVFKNQKSVNIQLRMLDTITSRAVIPDSISYNNSKENLTNKIKLYYISSLFKNDFDERKMFVDINIRKTETESAVYYTYLFKYLKDNNKIFDSNFFNWKIKPEVLSMVDSIEDNGEIFDGRDNIYNYYMQYKLLEIISQLNEFSEDIKWIEERKNLLHQFIIKNYTFESGIKTRRADDKSNYKNIAYLDILPKDNQKKILLSDYKKYYSEKLGVLINKNKDIIDMEYNLNFIIKLYENGFKEMADNLLFNLEAIIERNNSYIIPKIYLNKNNSAGIYGELLYLYLTAVQYRENNNNEHTK